MFASIWESPGILSLFGSLPLGILCWVLPLIGLVRLHERRPWQHHSAFSLAAGMAALQLQLQCAEYWVQKQDVSALLDCLDAMAWAGRWLTIVGLALNLLLWVAARRAQKDPTVRHGTE